MNRMRLRIAERLKQSQNTAASLTTFNEVDMSSLMEFRKLYKDDILKKSGVKLGFMSAFSRACVLAMKEVPAVNASIEGPNGGDTIVYRDYVDISVAVATEKGLVTPVVRNTETMDLIAIEKSIADLGRKVSRQASHGRTSFEVTCESNSHFTARPAIISSPSKTWQGALLQSVMSVNIVSALRRFVPRTDLSDRAVCLAR
jgi:low affinity Fe/Cu permease